jgi:hypothetical protein
MSILICIFGVFALSSAAILELTINYPEEQLNQTYIEIYDAIFNLNVYSCMENHVDNGAFVFGSPSCPGLIIFSASTLL